MLRKLWLAFCAVNLAIVFLQADSHQLKIFSHSDGMPADQITAITQDKQGNLWFGTWGEGAFKFDGKKFTGYKKGKGALPSNFIRTLYRDRNGDLWIGTENDGVAKYDGETFVAYHTKNSKLASNSVTCIFQDGKGRYWFGTRDRGLSTFAGRYWENYDKASSELPDNSIHAITEDKQGNLWIATPRGVCKFDGARLSVFNKKRGGLPDDDVNVMICDDRGDLWLGTESQWIIKFDGSAFVKQNIRGWYGSIRSVYKDRESKLWFGTDSGVLITYDGHNFGEVNLPVNVPPASARSGKSVKGIFQDNEENFWFATNFGAVRLDANPPAVAIEAPDKVLEGRTILIKFSGDDGRFGTKKSDLEYSYRLDAGPWSKFNRSTSVTVANLPSGKHRLQVQARDKSGNVSLPTEKAILIYARESLADKVPPQPYLTKKPPHKGTKRNLSFEFSAQDDTTPTERLMYSHRLVPVEDDWSEFSNRSHASYSNLKSGSYVFLLRARDEAKNISSTVVYDFTIERPFGPVVVTKNIDRDSASFEFAVKGSDVQADNIKFS